MGFWLTICALPDLTKPIPRDFDNMCRHGEEMGRQDARNLGLQKGVEIGEASCYAMPSRKFDCDSDLVSSSNTCEVSPTV